MSNNSESMLTLTDLDHKLIAVLRGLLPEHAEETGNILYEAGFRVIEVTLNSPSPLKSIETIRRSLPPDACIGAGTVTEKSSVQQIKDIGGNIVISPHTDAEIITETLRLGMISVPGVFSPTDVFKAFNAGARYLKFFPAEVLGLKGLKAIGAVLPKEATAIVVGGVNHQNMEEFMNNGFTWFGLGSNLFQAGDLPADTRLKVKHTVSVYREALSIMNG